MIDTLHAIIAITITGIWAIYKYNDDKTFVTNNKSNIIKKDENKIKNNKPLA